MQTTVQFNPIKLISQQEKSGSSGCLEVTRDSVSWKIYLKNGQLHYVYCSVQLLDQLKYYLHCLGWKKTLLALKQLPLSYTKQASVSNIYSRVISWLVTEKYLNASQALKLVEQITKDSFSSFLWLNEGNYNWQDEGSLPSWISQDLGDCQPLNISECLKTETTRLQEWQSCSDRLLSYHQRPYFNSGWERTELPTSGLLNKQQLQELAKIIRGRTSIRELSLLLQKDELQVAKILSIYIDKEIIFLRNAQAPLDLLPIIFRPANNIQKTAKSSVISSSNKVEKSTSKTWKIVCIDDSPTILNEIERFLGKDKFEVTSIDDPVKAVPIVFRIKPDLILLDITMPKINGYKLCSLLRNSKNCNQTPIIMVTGNTGFIDKARAKIVGATDYFTKPFTQEGLKKIVENNLKE